MDKAIEPPKNIIVIASHTEMICHFREVAVVSKFNLLSILVRSFNECDSHQCFESVHDVTIGPVKAIRGFEPFADVRKSEQEPLSQPRVGRQPQQPSLIVDKLTVKVQ